MTAPRTVTHGVRLQTGYGHVRCTEIKGDIYVSGLDLRKVFRENPDVSATFLLAKILHARGMELDE